MKCASCGSTMADPRAWCCTHPDPVGDNDARLSLLVAPNRSRDGGRVRTNGVRPRIHPLRTFGLFVGECALGVLIVLFLLSKVLR